MSAAAPPTAAPPMAPPSTAPAPAHDNDGSSSFYAPTESAPDPSSRARRRHDRAFYARLWEEGYLELQRLCLLPDQEKPYSPSPSWRLDDFLDRIMDKAILVRRLNARKKRGLPLRDEELGSGDEAGEDDTGDDQGDDAASVYSNDSIRVWKIRFHIIRALLPLVWRVDNEGNDEHVKEDAIKKWEDCVEELGDIDEPAPEDGQHPHAVGHQNNQLGSGVDLYEEVSDFASQTTELPSAPVRSMEEAIYGPGEGGEGEEGEELAEQSEDLSQQKRPHETPAADESSTIEKRAAVTAQPVLDTLPEEPAISMPPVLTVLSTEDVHTPPTNTHNDLPTLPEQFPPHTVIEAYSDVGRFLGSTRRIVSLAGPPSDDAQYTIIITKLGQEAILAPSPTSRIISHQRPTARSGTRSAGGESEPDPDPSSPPSPAFPTEPELECQFDLVARKILANVLIASPDDLDALITAANARFSSQAVADLVMRRVAELVGLEGHAGQKATFIQKLRVATLHRTQPTRSPCPSSSDVSTPTTRPIFEHSRSAPTPAPEGALLPGDGVSGRLSRRTSAISEGDAGERPVSAMDGPVKTGKMRPSLRNKFRGSWARFGKQQS